MSRSERSEEDGAVAQAVDRAAIPLIDFAPFLRGGGTGRGAVATKIARACRSTGFFHLAGHGVPAVVEAALLAQAAAYHHRPEPAKRADLATPERYRGWVPAPRAGALSRDTRLFDQYRIQLEWPAGERGDDPHDRLFDAPNRWPAGMPAFRAAVARYLEAMRVLSAELLRAFALGLELPERRFDGYFRRPPSTLSLLHYPPLPATAAADVSNMVPHTDEGPFTILAQDAVGGLEIRRRDGGWIAAPPIAGAFTINIGDMMMWWSNGAFLSNPHRVRNRSGGERVSAAFFASPDRDVVVGPLPEMVARTAAPRFTPVRVADHLARFYAAFDAGGAAPSPIAMVVPQSADGSSGGAGG